MKDKDSKKGLLILLRYIILVLIAVPNLFLFYFIFKPLTIYPIFSLLNTLFGASLYESTIRVGLLSIEIVNACVAGSAYYLLTILNLSTPNIKIGKRLKMLIFSLFSFLILNILRIAILSIMAIKEMPVFDVTHKILWYLGGTIFVVGIWFLAVKIFKVKDIPIYSDLKFLYKRIKK